MKLNYPKEWFLKSAGIEGDSEIGAGVPPWNSAAPGDVAPHPHATRIAFGRFVELWRRNKGWDADRLATEAGLDPDEILEIEHDPHSEPEPDAIYKLAKVFGVDPKGLYVMSGLIESKSSVFREKAVRFAARSENISKLNEAEHEALQDFVSALSEIRQDEI